VVKCVALFNDELASYYCLVVGFTIELTETRVKCAKCVLVLSKNI